MKIIFTMLSLVMLASCGSSKTKSPEMQYEADKILGRSDDLKERPKWVSETMNLREEAEKVQFIGMAEVPGDSRPTAAMKMSDLNAKGLIATKIEANITKMVQASDSGLSMEDQSLKSLILEMSQVTLKSVDIKDRYWEKVQRMSSDGTNSMVLKTFSLIELSKNDLQKLVLAKAKDAPAPQDLRNKVENIIRKQWDESNLE